MAASAPIEPPTEPPVEPRPDGRPRALALRPDGFFLDGAAFQIRAGEMHPIRIPRAQWAHRIAMARAMGLNTISIYLMWNSLETRPGRFDLSGGARDFRHFLDLCARAGMWVYCRPGPYVCAEWDLGGLPSWLLEEGDIRLRTRDPRFLAACARYIQTIAPALSPYLAQHGGPILLTQIENEYASFGADPAYMAWMRAAWVRHGLPGPFATADGLAELRAHDLTLPGCAIGLDGEDTPAATRALRADVPGWISEAYPGWLTHWGEPGLARVDFRANLDRILAARASFSLYVAHGGTNFGFGAGANADRTGGRFQPVITSYDYGAPIDEAGRPTPAYHAFRARIAQATGRAPAAIPPRPAVMPFAPVRTRRAGHLLDRLPEGVRVPDPRSFERALRQNQGMALYRCEIPPQCDGPLRLPPIHDWARLRLDGRLLGTVSRLDARNPGFAITPAPDARMLEILVDSFGHIGYGAALGDRKGIEGAAFIGDTPLTGWTIIPLPLDAAHAADLAARPATSAPDGMLFTARFDMPIRASTYIDMSRWGRGYLWVNGYLLGRFWRIGPQTRLFCPAEWLMPRGNRVLILDVEHQVPTTIAGTITLSGNSS